jgi:hypothetical protein
MILSPLELLQRRDGDIKDSRHRSEDLNVFPIEGEPRRSPETPSEQGSEDFNNPSPVDETFLCHHSTLAGVSESEIRIEIANHSVRYARAILAQINQIIYHLIRQAVAGLTSASALSGLLAARMITLLDGVAYSCDWAAKQMARWWGDGMSATTMRRVRDELEGWECFTVDRVAPASTHKITRLAGVDLKRLLLVASWVFERIAAELDGCDRYLPSHRCGLLASLWRLFFTGTFYAPDRDDPPPDLEQSIALARSRLGRAEHLAGEFSWSEFLAVQYREEVDRLRRSLLNLQMFSFSGGQK